MGDSACQSTVTNNVFNCVPSIIEAIESIDYGDQGVIYWTTYLEIGRESDNCHIYYKIINAVNLPPEIPPQVVGMDMNCNVAMTEFPITGLKYSWCSGSLVDYFIYIYTWS